MRIVKFILSLLTTLGLIFVLSSRLPVGESKTPPIGKFISPFVGFWQNAESRTPQLASNVALKGLKGTGKVVYDDKMVPHIFAENLEDAYYLQGYVTAQHRLWQMELQVFSAAGRLTEVVGERALKTDMLTRRMGLAHGAEAKLEKWKTTEGFNYVEAYTAGVNAYIHSLSQKDLPVEYKLLNYKPEDWSPLKVALLTIAMTRTLASYDGDIENQNALNLIGQDLFAYLFPDEYETDSPVIPPTTKWDFTPKAIPPPTNSDAQSVSYLPFESPPKGIGSNNWAVAGSKTKTGKPILAGDPHLNLTLPSIWYELQITTPECNVYGTSIPGMYGVIIGFNDSIAWSQTNVGRDVLDWYTIEWKNDRKLEYKYGDGYKKATIKIEEYKINGAKTVFDTVHYTHYGPIVYEGDHAQKDMALKWIAHLPPNANELMVFPKLNQAKNYTEYKAALSDYFAPAQNFVFASVQGDIAHWAQGSYPLKSKGQGKFILNGSNPDNEWHGFIPFEHNPHVLNPPRGFVASANQKSTAADYPYYYRGRFSDYRGRILNRFLSNMDSITSQKMMDLQLSNHSLFAEEALPLLLQHLDTSKLSKEDMSIVQQLRDWDYNFEKDSKIAPVFMEWFTEIYDLIWDEFKDVKEKTPVNYPEKRRTFEIIAQNPTFEYFDIKSTKDTVETLQDLTFTAFQNALAVIRGMDDGKGNGIVWSKYKKTTISHLGRIKEFSAPITVGGQGNALNAIGTRSGPSWRMVVELGKKVKAYGVYPGGQSGNPGSFYYQSMLEHWVNGDYYELLFLKDENSKNSRIISTQRFSGQ